MYKGNPQKPNRGKVAGKHDMNHKDNIYGGNGTDCRGGANKSKTVTGLVHSIPEHFSTQNGSDKPNKKMKIEGGR
jgi:hypothetical protein